MKNVTITLDEKVAQWARVEAAKAGKSLSRWLGERLENDMRHAAYSLTDLESFLSGPGYPGIAANMPRRDDLYDDRDLRRQQHSDLQPRSQRTDEKDQGG
ncbi:hypothetical protein GGR25_004204 [Kaistia hirudinis]|uniref:CopG family transcriptional regulator n=1 Tax=Kaistia hirudinis TaxID=1293440 RepID=A0A840ARX5_9HYPH|nr:hypothetical protein [Kaistia hirudinis]MBB3933140.1 hypothetical protein [Kaistia hirudinis]